MIGDLLIGIGILLFIVGFLVILVGTFYEFFHASKKSVDRQEETERKTEAGGIIFIGPIPIIFGSSKNITKIMLAIALAITIILVIIYIIPYIV
ncbi:hypothetical protein HS7_19620 [Sulfolobales archaeon HS-7]|nr:hypothetical protein HS7_19620 [Sulfolobales archaeon HS-7]